MATFSAVTRQHILQAIAEYDTRGRDDFLGVYGFTPSTAATFEHEGRSYESGAVLGVAHRHATGRLATSDEFASSVDAASSILRKRGFEVTAPAARPAAPVRAEPRKRTQSAQPAKPARKSNAAPEAPPVLCPTCSMVLPATGFCDYCA
ncbi:hypothetical protein [Cellulomonas oligotrophica]|uniref:ScoMcrA-like N-terminal head domain-containing protein n=1 Tax=Cellulomonas oligotrophica TaxID=931536 RepID=A0A7Y9JXC9_9CELL|nr:hypothetical protein [Cellulomonas oligotrophica]NYD86568.1 hypothetical protein [Cellulomonas oligotrophica]GIG32542.1 hypothetical protein Col01nite_17010 [Cellulomonas oligotrophica]